MFICVSFFFCYQKTAYELRIRDWSSDVCSSDLDRHAPHESGVVARAASGALELVPWVRVVNLARALDEIAEAECWRIGLTGNTETTLADAIGDSRVALVLGAEGEGMRQNTETHCDVLARLPISPKMESLNVSNAAAIALYAATGG